VRKPLGSCRCFGRSAHAPDRTQKRADSLALYARRTGALARSNCKAANSAIPRGRQQLSALTKEDWMFDRLLESAPLSTIRICRLYEYAREVTVCPKNSSSFGEMAMLLTRPELIPPLFGFCITKPGCSGDWLRKPYFKLSSRIRDDLDKLYDSHCGALID